MNANKIGRVVDNKQFVLCKKSIKTFIKGVYYPILGTYGDFQGAYEAGFEFMDTKFLNVIIIMDNNPGEEFYFDWKGRNKNMAKYVTEGFFQDYFISDIKEERKTKLNNLFGSNFVKNPIKNKKN